MSHSLATRLSNQGQFLALSRTDADLFSTPLSFTLDNQTRVHIQAPGIIAFYPQQAGDKAIVLSCGVHGNETAPIEILDAMVADILTGELSLVQPLLVQFGNLAAMDIGERFVEENMNRLFSGAHSLGPGLVNHERRRAKALEDAICDFYAACQQQATRIHYDLHTAIRESKNEKFAVYPYLHDEPHSLEQLRFLQGCEVNTILLSNGPTTTFSYYSSHTHGAHAFTLELGKVRPFGQNDMDRFAAITARLRELVSQTQVYLPELDQSTMELYRVHRVINRNKTDFVLNFADDTPNFTDFPLGYCLAEEPGMRYEVDTPGEAIVFPNAKVALGQRALLTVVPVALDSLKVQ